MGQYPDFFHGLKDDNCYRLSKMTHGYMFCSFGPILVTPFLEVVKHLGGRALLEEVSRSMWDITADLFLYA